jgi:hypothetical protein
MARRKKTPETSRIARVSTVAYARRQKTGGASDGPDAGAEAEPEAGAEAARDADAAAGGGELDAKFDVTDRSQPVPTFPAEEVAPKAAAPTEEVAPKAAAPTEAAPKAAAPTEEAAPKAAAPTEVAPKAAAPTDASAQERATLTMPVAAKIGRPPEMPSTPAPAGISPRADAVEDPTNMPGPKEIPAGSPGDPAPAPGRVPPGDSRSLRRRDASTYEFALIYRRQTFVITRFGVVGTRGQWRVVEYPTSVSASHAYAKECSRFVSDGFSDYRE